MKATVDRKAFASIITKLKRVLCTSGWRSSTMAFNYSCKITADNGRVEVAINNLDVVVRASLKADMCVEGTLVVEIETLEKILRKSKGDVVTLEPVGEDDDHRLVLKVANKTMRFEGSDPADFPVDKKLDGEQASAPIKLVEFTAALAKAARFTSTDLSRESLCGVHLDTNTADKPVLVSTDGHRLFQKELETGTLLGVPDVHFSNLFVKALGIFCPKKEHDATLYTVTKDDRQRVEVVFGDVAVSTNRLKLNFPDWRQVLGRPQGGYSVNKGEFVDALKMAKDFVDKSGFVKMRYEAVDNKVTLSDRSKDYTAVLVPVTSGQDTCTFNYNTQYMLDVLAAIEGDLVSVAPTDKWGPIHLKDTEAPEDLYLLMPMKD